MQNVHKLIFGVILLTVGVYGFCPLCDQADSNLEIVGHPQTPPPTDPPTTAPPEVDCATFVCQDEELTVRPNPRADRECRVIGNGPAHPKPIEMFNYNEDRVSDAWPDNKCPTGEVLLTSTSASAESLAGSEGYKKCCGPKVLDECRMEMKSQFDCANGELGKIFMEFENKTNSELTKVVFDPDVFSVECIKQNGDAKYIDEDTAGKSYWCGSRNLGVKIQRLSSDKLRVKRYQCNSQYVIMYIDHNNHIRIVTKSVVDSTRSDKLNGAGIGPVLAQADGLCGAMATVGAAGGD